MFVMHQYEIENKHLYQNCKIDNVIEIETFEDGFLNNKKLKVVDKIIENENEYIVMVEVAESRKGLNNV